MADISTEVRAPLQRTDVVRGIDGVFRLYHQVYYSEVMGVEAPEDVNIFDSLVWAPIAAFYTKGEAYKACHQIRDGGRDYTWFLDVSLITKVRGGQVVSQTELAA